MMDSEKEWMKTKRGETDEEKRRERRREEKVRCIM